MQWNCDQPQYWLSYGRCAVCDVRRVNFTNKLTRHTSITKRFCERGQGRVKTIPMKSEVCMYNRYIVWRVDGAPLALPPYHLPPLKSTEGNIFGMYVAKINFPICANRYYSQLLCSSGGSGKLLPQPTTTNNKHHDHDGDVCPSGSMVLMDLPVLMDGRPSKGVGRGRCWSNLVNLLTAQVLWMVVTVHF